MLSYYAQLNGKLTEDGTNPSFNNDDMKKSIKLLRTCMIEDTQPERAINPYSCSTQEICLYGQKVYGGRKA